MLCYNSAQSMDRCSAPHPVQVHRQFPRHRYFRNLPSTPHGQVKELAAPLRLTPHRDLRRFHQQNVALLADVAQPATISAGLFRRNQPDVAGQLLSAMKALRSALPVPQHQSRFGLPPGFPDCPRLNWVALPTAGLGPRKPVLCGGRGDRYRQIAGGDAPECPGSQGQRNGAFRLRESIPMAVPACTHWHMSSLKSPESSSLSAERSAKWIPRIMVTCGLVTKIRAAKASP